MAALAFWKLRLVLALLFFAFIIAAAMRVGYANSISAANAPIPKGRTEFAHPTVEPDRVRPRIAACLGT